MGALMQCTRAMQWMAAGFATGHPHGGTGAEQQSLNPLRFFPQNYPRSPMWDSGYPHIRTAESCLTGNFRSMGEAGVEPARPFGQQVLSLSRLPVPPQSLLRALGCPRIDSLGLDGSGVIFITRIALGAFCGPFGEDLPSQSRSLTKDLTEGYLKCPDLGLSKT